MIRMFCFRAQGQPPFSPQKSQISYQVIGYVSGYIQLYSILYSHIIHVVFGWRIVFKRICFAFVEQVLKLVWGYHGKSTWNPCKSSRVPRHVETECTCWKHTPLQCKHHFMDCLTHPDSDRFIIWYNDIMNDIMIYIHIMYT